jgi:plasmid stabilization system protein ParE
VTLTLRWTERAVLHLEALVDYVSLTSPVYAEGIVSRIDQRLQLACTHPEIGKVVVEVQDSALRELVVPPYRIFYRIRTDAIEVLAIVHERRHMRGAL